MLTQATNSVRKSTMTAPIVTHSIGRSGGQRELWPPLMMATIRNGPPKQTTAQGGQQHVREPGQGVGGAHEGFAPARAAIRSRQ